MFAEFRAGQFGYNFGLDSNTEATRYEDVITNEITGGGRHWLNKRRRNQYTGAMSFFRDNFAGGSHNIKVGGEYLDESGNILWQQGYADSVIHFLSSGAPTIVRLYNSGTSSQNGLATTSVVRHRHLDGRSADAQRRRPVRSLPRAPAGTVDPGVALQPGRANLCRDHFGEDLQPHRAAVRRHLRSQRRRQDGAEGQLGTLLLQPRRQPRRLGQSQLERSVRRTTTGPISTTTASSSKASRAWKSGVRAAPPARRSIRTW